MLAEEIMYYKNKLIILTLSFIFSYNVTTVKGVILDENNEPLNNVYIFIWYLYHMKGPRP